MYEYSCTVDRVVDGDTIDVILDLGFDILYRSRVRLYGIDTPESRTRDKDEKVRGKLAGAFLQEAIDNGSKVIIETNVIVDGININQQMIDNYLAVAYFGQSKTDIEEEHLRNKTKLIKLGKHTPVE